MAQPTTRDTDAAELAASYRVVEEAATAFMQSMEVALPLYQKLVEARKKRAEMRDAYRLKYQLAHKPTKSVE